MIQKHSTVLNKIGLSADTNQQRGRQTRSNTSQTSQNRMMNRKSSVGNTENSELHRYCQKEMLSLLHQFPFEYVTLKHNQVGDYNSKRALYEFSVSLLTLVLIVASLVIVESFLETLEFQRPLNARKSTHQAEVWML